MKEIWKDVKGYEGLYQVSNLGRIRSLRNNYMILKLGTDQDGYNHFTPCRNGTQTTKKIHRLVAQAFIPNPKNKIQVNHKNGIKLDNKVTNLEWSTDKENKNHAWKNGLVTAICGDKHYNHKLTEKDVIYIRKSKLSDQQLADKFNVHKSCINGVRNRYTWKHI